LTSQNLSHFENKTMARRIPNLVSGRITNLQNQPLPGLTVYAFDQDPKTPDNLLGDKAITNVEGYYIIHFTEQDFKVGGVESGGPDIFIRVYKNDKLLETSSVRRNVRKNLTLNLQIDYAGPDWVIRGRILSSQGRKQKGLSVVAIDKNIGKEIELGTGVTNSDGTYEVQYSIGKLKDNKEKPDLQILVKNADGEILAKSSPRYNAKSVESHLDVTVPTDKLPPSIEYQRLLGELNTHLGNLTEETALKQRLADLKEEEDQQEISYLANKTGWDARLVAMGSLASQISQLTGPDEATQIEPEFFYALFRSGIPANKARLSNLPKATVEKIWRQALELGILPAELEDKIPGALEKYEACSTDWLLADDEDSKTAQIGVSTFKERVESTLDDLVDNNEKEKLTKHIAKVYYQHKGNLRGFWQSLKAELPEANADDIINRLQLDSQLNFLTLNNAPLVKQLHQRAKAQNQALKTPLDLIKQGYYQPESWEELLHSEAVPEEIAGETDDEKRANYQTLLANQLRLSYPTAVIAEMVGQQTIPIAAEAQQSVKTFLYDHQDKFDLGLKPIEQYLHAENLSLGDTEKAEIKKLQRVYQITLADEDMGILLRHQIDSAYAISRYDEQTFINTFQAELGNNARAKLIYAKAHQVHNAVLNIAVNYGLQKTALTPYAIENLLSQNENDRIAEDLLRNQGTANTGVIAYPTLEEMFGEMDYCTCEHCRSWLSPAAYLVDLLLFLERDPAAWDRFTQQWAKDRANTPYPFSGPDQWTAWQQNNPDAADTYQPLQPLDVLLQRRPDIEHLQLTCDNTNTVLPYIDLVNEVLEYYVVNDGLIKVANDGSKEVFQGHNIEGSVTTEDLLASPQFVNEAAYKRLQEAVFPLSLPFHKPLETLRRYFKHFDIPLHGVMERLCQNDEETSGNGTALYGWRDILIERLRLSRQEYKLLIDSRISLPTLYGETQDITDEALISDWVDAPKTKSEDDASSPRRIGISNAKLLSQKLGVSYEELIAIIRTQFINPHSHLIPKLEKLGISLQTIQAFLDGDLSEEDLKGKLSATLNETAYGGCVPTWIRNHQAKIEELILLSDPTGINDPCSFDTLEIRYSRTENNQLKPFEFHKLLRFVRLWRKLGWSIEQTDKVITALYPADQRPDASSQDETNETAKTKLGQGFVTLIPRLAHLLVVMEQLELTPKRDLLPLLACWSTIETHGPKSLYHQMFLNPTILKLDNIFQEDGYGHFLRESHLFNFDETLNDLDSQKYLEKLQEHFTEHKIAFTFDENTRIEPINSRWYLFSAIEPWIYIIRQTDSGSSVNQAPKLLHHTEVLRSAFNLTREELDLLLEALNFGQATVLNLENLSTIFRYGYLARQLRLSVQEFLGLKAMSGLDPFLPLDLVDVSNSPQPFGGVRPPAIRLIELAQRIKTSPLTICQLQYLLQHIDLSGSATPAQTQMLALARTLRNDLLRIEQEHSVEADPTGEIAKAQMALVYSAEVADIFFGLLNRSTKFTADYSQNYSTLEEAIWAGYDLLLIDDNNERPEEIVHAVLLKKAGNGYNLEIIDPDGKPIINDEHKGFSPDEEFAKELKDVFNQQENGQEISTDKKKEIIRKIISRAENIHLVGLEFITYDHFPKKLVAAGIISDSQKNDLDRIELETAASTEAFHQAVTDLFDQGQETVAEFFEQYVELKRLYENFVDSTDSIQDKLLQLLHDLLPELKVELKQQQICQVISIQADTDFNFVSSLLNNASLLKAQKDAETQSRENEKVAAIDDFLTLEEQGLSFEIFFSDNGQDTPDKTGIINMINYPAGETALPVKSNDDDESNDDESNDDESNDDESSTIRGCWKGFIEAPNNGFYNFLVEADQKAKATLKINDEIVLENQERQNQTPIFLEAGKLYKLELSAQELSSVLILRWERKGMGRQVIQSSQLYPATSIANFESSYLRLLKVVAISKPLELSINEIAHFAQHQDYLIDDQSWLNALPIQGNTTIISSTETEAKDTTLTEQLLRNISNLLHYHDLKQSLKIKDESLLELLKEPSAQNEDGSSRFSTVTRWRERDRDALITHFGKKVDDLSHLETIIRLQRALEISETLGIGAETLVKVTSNDPHLDNPDSQKQPTQQLTIDPVRTLQAALRARYEEHDWRQVIQPINDELRSMQRDALVAYVLDKMRRDAATAHIDTPDKLFEYFFIDVQMAPCMKTSRVKQALSTVQLFIQRCLMNLEPQVAAVAIDAKKWEWMKRYRVWEANRKVFLWPENWLEPELRDNKSPEFKELESELLQSDITDEAAAKALVHYLEKLSQVAKLEICGMAYEENELNNKADDVIHVIARTTGASRTYYYRRQEGGFVWTPWEKIDLNIEDTPILPVVWQGRLFLFWVSVLQEASSQKSGTEESEDLKAVDATLSDLNNSVGEAKTKVKVILYWSEYYQSKWHPPHTSDINNPLIIGDFLPGEFRQQWLQLWCHEHVDTLNKMSARKNITIAIAYPSKIGHYKVCSTDYSYYESVSPERVKDDFVRVFTSLDPEDEKLGALLRVEGRESFILGHLDSQPISAPVQFQQPITQPFECPFIFQDANHAFFVDISINKVLIPKEFNETDLGISYEQSEDLYIDPLVEEEILPDLSGPVEGFSSPYELIISSLSETDLTATTLEHISNVKQVVFNTDAIQFGNAMVGPIGSLKGIQKEK
jgi:hypothetical protein